MHNIKSLCLTALVGILLNPIAAQENPGQHLVTETAVIMFAVPLPTAVDNHSTQSTQKPISANTHRRLDVVSDTQPDTLPPGSQSDGNSAETLGIVLNSGEVKPSEAVPEVQPTIEPLETQPNPLTSVVNPDPSPSVVSPDPSPSIVNPDPSPSVANPDPSPSVANPDPSPSVVNPDPSPSVVNPDPSPSVANPDPSPSVANPDPSPSVVNPDPSPSVVNPDPSPSIINPDPSPSIVNPDPSPSIVNPDPSPSVVNPDPFPSVVIPDPSPSEIQPEPTEAAKPSVTANPSGVPESVKPAEPECSTTPPDCTKTLSYIELDNKFTSTVFGDCPGPVPMVDCVLGEQSTTTTTIVPDITVASNTDDLSGEEPVSADDDFEKDDNDIKEYLEKQFEDAGISHQDELVLEADIQCKDGDVQIPSSCFERIYPAFCSEQAQNPSQKLVKGYAPSAAKSETKRMYRPALHERRIDARGDECNDLYIEFAWIPESGDCDLNCTTVMKTFEGQCILDGGQSWAEIDMGCGAYGIIPAKSSAAPPAATSTAAAPPPQPTEPQKQPLQVNPAVCEDESKYPGHADIQKRDQAEMADHICEGSVSDEGQVMGPGDTMVERSFRDNYGVNYYFSISWIDGCMTTVDKQDFDKPVGGNTWTCENIFTSAYNGCNNHGVGGQIDAGCLRYKFIGGQ
ncbi:hypothetical protein ACHAPJ_012658 [Fusarium lateritium]